MPFPKNLSLYEACQVAYQWPAAMDYLVANINKEEAEAELTKAIASRGSKIAALNHEFKFLYEAVTQAKPIAYKTVKANPAKTALIAEVEKLAPRFVAMGEADGEASYLILDADTVIGLGDYQEPVRQIKDLPTAILGAALDEDCDLDWDGYDWQKPYLEFFAGKLGKKLMNLND